MLKKKLVPFRQPDLHGSKYSPKHSPAKKTAAKREEDDEYSLLNTFSGFTLNVNHEIENFYPRLNTIGKFADVVERNKIKAKKSIGYNE